MKADHNPPRRVMGQNRIQQLSLIEGIIPGNPCVYDLIFFAGDQLIETLFQKTGIGFLKGYAVSERE
jgi:ABC-type microcin C transport system permease subunit YejB